MKLEYDFSAAKRGRFFVDSGTLTLPASNQKPDWCSPTGRIGKFIDQVVQQTLESYRAQPRLVIEHANLEHDTAHGGYARRQLFELVQNSADTLLDTPNGKSILIRLTGEFLYCADDGIPIDEHGIEGLMFSHMSSKKDTAAIGRFGLGFKSVLAVTDCPEFYSRSGSFRFDRTHAADRIAQIAPADRYPVLRLPEPIDPSEEVKKDKELQELMSWATNVVRLPLNMGAHDELVQQIRDFPPEFLLFVDHVRYLTLEDGEHSREFMLQEWEGELHLHSGHSVTRWRCFETTRCLSADARSDQPSLDDQSNVRIWWAAPLDQLDRPGQFWAFFPTKTTSLVAGILNARWKTNEDRQNLLTGRYNEELIKAAAEMISEQLPRLTTTDDPARHLDVLPRRREGGDPEHADLLRRLLFSELHECKIIPDQDGKLHVRGAISYPPRELTPDRRIDTAPLDRWSAFSGRPANWLHHIAVTRNRLATIDRLCHPDGEPPAWRTASGAPRATVSEWLQALVENKGVDEAVQASMAAVQTAALVPVDVRNNVELGKIVLTTTGEWLAPDAERLFLPDEAPTSDDIVDRASYVHRELAADPDTRSALKKLGVQPPSAASRFERVARRILQSGSGEASDGVHQDFWIVSRKLRLEAALEVIRKYKDSWRKRIRVMTRSGAWRPLHLVLLPGDIVPGDGSRDDDTTVNISFHESDAELMRDLSVTEKPREDYDLSVEEPLYQVYRNHYRTAFTKRDLERNPQLQLLEFEASIGCGPLSVLTVLSEQGRARYTDALLARDVTYHSWTMRHATRDIYPPLRCESFSIWMLIRFGRVRTPSSIAPLADALGRNPKNPEALDALLSHEKADKIKAAFDLAEPTPEIYSEDDPIPLTDVWPGLKQYLPSHQRTCRLIRCERILVVGQDRECIVHATNVYLSDAVHDERRKLQLVTDQLNLRLNADQLDRIVQRRTPQEVEERRAAIRKHLTDARRLLAAVGEHNLRRNLPRSLLAVLEEDDSSLTGNDLAEAAIATWHTDALKQYHWALDHLDPPRQWAGSERIVEFVRSLGFSADWAGERRGKRDPYLEVDGPYRLPELHGYQRTIANRVRNMLGNGRVEEDERRAMISMPTGSGKTRVAVQAIVEAMRDAGFCGGVLWVADRDELCEQAVEAWRQIWSGIGAQAERLRISRMWGGLERPRPSSDRHVVVATVQTLSARLSNYPREYGFLASFKLIVFDEAHRSIAPSFTSVMQELGLTRFRKKHEPFLLGLTATPYRGINEEETTRLVRRYGNRRLDAGAFASDEPEAVIRELQQVGVLARADHDTIEGETLALDSTELQRSYPWLSPSAEQRIAGSAERTRRIVEAYEESIDRDWPSLIFATSVEHAQTVAALLNRKGIRARAISGETEIAARRRVVEEFRNGAVKALVNYAVFREGFDAPKTRAIIVARPVYSPNLYFQMIGRGLRGPKNGGDERCLVLDVRDNVENFDRRLAFSELEWLWS